MEIRLMASRQFDKTEWSCPVPLDKVNYQDRICLYTSVLIFFSFCFCVHCQLSSASLNHRSQSELWRKNAEYEKCM